MGRGNAPRLPITPPGLRAQFYTKGWLIANPYFLLADKKRRAAELAARLFTDKAIW